MQRQHHKIQQNTEEWFELRLGRFTASTFGDLFMGKSTAGYQKAIYRPVYERLTGEQPESFTTPAMERGHEIEGLAAEWYEQENFEECSPGGFWTFGDWLGASPDRLIGDDGILEIKSPLYNTMFNYMLGKKKIDKSYFWQVYGQLYVTGRQWCDLVFFHPKLKPVVKRFNSTDDEMGELELRLRGATKEAIEILTKLEAA